MSTWFANLVISAAQAGLAGGSAASLRKGAAKGAGSAGLFFLLLGLSFFIVLDYNSRFSPVTGTGKTVGLFVFGSLVLTASGFVPYMTMSRKGNAKAKSAAPGTSMAVYLLVSGLMGLGLGGIGGAQSVILTNMYVLLGSILGFNALAAKSDQGAMSNSVMAALGLILLALFDAMGANKGTGEVEAEAPGAEVAVNAQLASLEQAVTNAQAAVTKAGAIADGNNSGEREGKLALQKTLEAAQQAVAKHKAAKTA
jgi:hypothetical protein